MNFTISSFGIRTTTKILIGFDYIMFSSYIVHTVLVVNGSFVGSKTHSNFLILEGKISRYPIILLQIHALEGHPRSYTIKSYTVKKLDTMLSFFHCSERYNCTVRMLGLVKKID